VDFLQIEHLADYTGGLDDIVAGASPEQTMSERQPQAHEGSVNICRSRWILFSAAPGPRDAPLQHRLDARLPVRC